MSMQDATEKERERQGGGEWKRTGEGEVGPGVDSNLMASHVFILENVGAGDDSGADDEEGGLELGLVEVVEELRGVWSRSLCSFGSALNLSIRAGHKIHNEHHRKKDPKSACQGRR